MNERKTTMFFSIIQSIQEPCESKYALVGKINYGRNSVQKYGVQIAKFVSNIR